MQRMFLIGLPGAGKSTVGRQIAKLLGWDFVDMDDALAQRCGLSAGQILATYGEQRFRQLESEILFSLAERERIVVATGGGAVLLAANRACMQEYGLVIYLHTSVEIAWQRIQMHIHRCGDEAVRPLLSGEHGQQQLQVLYQERKHWYEQAELHITTDEYKPDTLARQIVASACASGYLTSPSIEPQVVTLNETIATSQAIIVWGGLAQLPQKLHIAGFCRRIFIVTDSVVGSFYARPVQDVLLRAGMEVHIFAIPAGETSKSFQWMQHIVDWLVEYHVEQNEPLLALGGGVVGDMTGFVASCYHRGIPCIQVPTSLLAQVDAAIGGKTGINHPQGKNLIGAYYHPRLILVDPATLLTLPERVYREGWAEVVKYGMICDTHLFELLERHVPAILARDAAVLSTIVTRCIQLKMQVIEQDERDTGLRNILNYGHTFGHALEALTNYSTWLHGEAVAVGMEVAARIAVARGLLSPHDAARQHQLLCKLGLPVQYTGLDTSRILTAMRRDKKVRNGHMRWILPTSIGHASMYDDIPLVMVQEAIEALQPIYS